MRKVSRQEVDGHERSIEVLHPSMYCGVEVHRNMSGRVVNNTGYGVNHIYLNGSGQDVSLQTQNRMF